MKKFSLKVQIAAGVILIFGGTLVFFNNYIKEKRDAVFSEMNLLLSLDSINQEEFDTNDDPSLESQEEESSKEEKPKEEIPKEEPKEESNKDYEEYAGILDIPKINFYKGFYNKNSNLNNVKFNLYVLPESNYPDTENGNFIVAGHSGNYNNSYFANLYKLATGDNVIVHYQNKDYTYKISKVYYVKKTGKIKIIRNKKKTVITLITCTKDDETRQTVYIGELVNKK